MKNYLLLLLIFTCSSCYFLGPSSGKRLKAAIADKPYDVAIVPGLPFKDGKCDTLLKTRILWSVYLYNHGIVKNIIYSGSAVYSPYVEAEGMALYAKALGVDPKHIFTDTLAEHSTENLYYSYQIAREHGFSKIALATDPFQTYLLYKFAQKQFDTKIHFIPVVYDSIAQMMNNKLDIDISTALSSNYTHLAEKESLKQRIKASRGGKVK